MKQSDSTTGNTRPVSLRRIEAAFDAAVAAAAVHLGATSPNPAVGCALLDDDGAILVTAAHHRAGAPHAEARALSEAHRLGVIDRVRTAVVTLEPCNHTGRTPPCAGALRDSPVRNVWIGAADPNPLASGGARRLMAPPDGRAVHFAAEEPALSACHRACAALIAPFARRVIDGRAWITVKQALTAQGSMIPPGDSTTFTDASSLRLAHVLRRGTDAIITGAGTILADRPRFSVRHVADHPHRLTGDAPRLLAIGDRRGRLTSADLAPLRQAGFEILIARDLPALPFQLAERGVNWAMVEAGPALLDAILADALWDDWLTLRQVPGREDHRALRSRATPSPLSLLPGAGVLHAAAESSLPVSA